jgi:hypothetical protein
MCSQGRSGSDPTQLEWMIRRSGTIDSPQWWYRAPGMVELVGSESTVVDEGGLAEAWQKFAVHVKWYGKVCPWLCHITRNTCGTELVWRTPLISVSPVTVGLL